ncbi:MAG: hypothetical protein Q8K65_01380 [Alphaproteobacteria bacterium]|nr:hypothetical protein [Alphaproteobacteria bacterium]
MKKIFIAAALAATLFAGGFFWSQSRAQAPHDHHDNSSSDKQELVYTCTPDHFTLTQNGDSYILAASLETPTPGYSYEIIPVETRSGRIKAKLKLRGVDGAMIQVIGNIDISHTFEYTGMLHALSIAVEKDFNWGPTDVNCTHQ